MLYLVSTPIGNLQDISFRAVEVLKMCDVIACEDTRHSKILLDYYGIKERLIAYHKHNEQASSQGIVQLINEGKNVALISDAGMPVINDPGSILINTMIENKLPYTIIPGANAGLCALVLSGFDASVFAFFGFLSEKNKEQKIQLEKIKNFEGTKILYSSKHNINSDLQNLFKSLGNLKVCIVSEISKLHESIQFSELGNANISDPKGEYVIVIAHNVAKVQNFTDEQIITQVSELIKDGVAKTEAFRTVAAKINKPKNYVYNLYEKSSGN